MLTAADVAGIARPRSRPSLSIVPAPALEAEGAELVAADRKNRSLSNAGHRGAEAHRALRRSATVGSCATRSTICAGFPGTTDVEQGAQAGGALIEGRDVRRILRRRIHKPDGRVLEPDKASYASQEHSDFSQLEKGDYVEQILEGWALPGASGQLVVDTPDLLPERTSVQKRASSCGAPGLAELAMWSHALWGKPSERIDGAQKVTTFTMKAVIRVASKKGVPKMDRDVAVSFGTSSWKLMGQSIAEAITSLEDRDPYVSRWAGQPLAEATAKRRSLPAASPKTSARSSTASCRQRARP